MVSNGKTKAGRSRYLCNGNWFGNIFSDELHVGEKLLKRESLETTTTTTVCITCNFSTQFIHILAEPRDQVDLTKTKVFAILTFLWAITINIKHIKNKTYFFLIVHFCASLSFLFIIYFIQTSHMIMELIEFYFFTICWKHKALYKFLTHFLLP